MSNVEQRLTSLGSQVGALARHLRKSRSIDATGTLGKVATTLVLASLKDMPAARVVEEVYPEDIAVAEALASPGQWLSKAVTNPAQTTIAGWAADVAPVSGVVGAVAAVAPRSVYAQLAARSLRVDLSGAKAMRLPARSDAATVGGAFIAEADAIPMRKLALSAVLLEPKKLGVISAFSKELAARSTPSVETVVREAMATDTALVVDGVLLGNAPADAAQPAGLLNGVTAIPATAGGGIAALAADLGALAAALDPATSIVYLMNAAEAVRATILSPGAASLPIILGPVPSKTVIAVDAADFASAESDTPIFDVVDGATVVTDDAVPVPAWGSVPTISMFQMAFIGVRLLQDLSWAMRRPDRVQLVEAVTW